MSQFHQNFSTGRGGTVRARNLRLGRQWFLLAASVLVLRVVGAVFVSYRDYMPPDFQSAFLVGRGSYFFDGYHFAFYAHIVSGPLSLLAGMLLVSDRMRRMSAAWHRRLGKLQVANVLLLVSPSGLWMSFYSDTGMIAGAGFATLAMVTAATAWFGWRTAVRRQFAIHRRWMWRCYLLLCSAVVLRMMGGLATVANATGDWSYQVSAWACWVLPLAVYEGLRYWNHVTAQSGR